MTKKEQKYIESLKDENDGLRSLLIRFIDEVGKLTNIDDVVNMSLIPLMTEKTKKFKSEFKSEAYKEVEEMIDKTTWYHINKNGELVQGANSETDIPLYKAKDVHNLLKELVGEDK